MSNWVQGGQYIQVIQNPFSKPNKDITAEVFYIILNRLTLGDVVVGV